MGNIINTIDHLSQPPNMVVIEDVFVGFNKQVAKQLIELGAVVKNKLITNNIPITLIPPKDLKKQFTGNGKADKQMMMDVAYQIYKHKFDDDNQCDAYALTQVWLNNQ